MVGTWYLIGNVMFVDGWYSIRIVMFVDGCIWYVWYVVFDSVDGCIWYVWYIVFDSGLLVS